MINTVLPRAAVAVAALTISMITWTATPSLAATPPGVTREMVLRASGEMLAGGPGYTHEANDSLRSVVNTMCGIDTWSSAHYIYAEPVSTSTAQGFVVRALINVNGYVRYQECTFGAVAVVAGSDRELSGSYAFSYDVQSWLTNGPPTSARQDVGALSGTVFVTTPRLFNDHDLVSRATLALNGTANRATTTTAVVRIAVPASPAKVKAAKATYRKSLAAAKSSYRKAVVRAGKSSSRAAKAKKTYRRATAKARLTYVSATRQFVNAVETRPSVDAAPLVTSVTSHDAVDRRTQP